MARLVLVSACALIDADGRVLLARRPPEKPMGGLWEFPGGKLKEGETPEGALVRELKEELDLDVVESCLSPIACASHDSGSFHLLMPLFACRKWSGSPRPMAHQALKWAPAKDLLRYKMPPADGPLAAQLRDLLCVTC
ncbi:MAG: (deoxy)nucleoside triphosphate pyrophosphohydrolase [Parvularculaceae bacterium]